MGIEDVKLLYLSLWYHPLCGGRPYAYHNQHVVCELCGYKIAAPNSEPLGSTLMRSEFVPKKGRSTYIA